MAINKMVWFFIMAGMLISTASPTQATLMQANVLNTLEFSYVENIFGPDGIKKAGLDLAPGDQLVGILSVSRIVAGGETVYTAGPTSQLTGIYAHKVMSVPPYFIQGGVSYDPHLLTAAYAYTEFGNPDLRRLTDGTSTINLSSILAPGEMFALWLDQGSTATAYTTMGSLADDVSRATDGIPFASFGLGDSGYFYSQTNPYVSFADLLNGALIGKAFSGLEVFTNNTGLPLGSIFNPDDREIGVATPLAITCNLGIKPAEFPLTQAAPWTLAGEGTAQLYPVPEPSTFNLLAISGVAMFLCQLKRRS